MPWFGSGESSSLRKMELVGGRNYGGGSKFSMDNIIGDPFSLATIGIAICGWLIAFISSIIADVETNYPNFAWWTLVYMLGCIIGVFVVVATDSTQTYHVALVGFMAAGLVFTTSSVNSLIYYSQGSKEAGAAGFILLSMVAIVWIFYFGSQPQAAGRQAIDSFALHKDRGPSRRQSRHMTQSYGGPETRNSAPQVVNSSALVGFENTSPVAGYPGGRPGEIKPDNTNPNNQPSAFAPLHQQQQPQPLPQQPSQLAPSSTTFLGPTGPVQPDNPVAQPTEYPYRAKAIYSYEANPDDANEISFTKHEILEVSDVSGRWWQAKKETGETGIAPSNYLILL